MRIDIREQKYGQTLIGRIDNAAVFDGSFRKLARGQYRALTVARFSRDDGSLFATMRNIWTSGNLDDGVQLEETDDGDLIADIAMIVATDNSKWGLKVEQQDIGVGTLKLRGETLEQTKRPVVFVVKTIQPSETLDEDLLHNIPRFDFYAQTASQVNANQK